MYIYPIYVNFVEKFVDTSTGATGSVSANHTLWGNHFVGISYLAALLDSYTGS
jgi:hypothetical protein